MKKPAIASWEKWVLMTVIIFGLSGIVVWFNLRVFGLADGAPYIAVVGLVALASLLITRHVRRYPVVFSFVVAAYIFEVLLTVCLCVNAVYSLSVLRAMSVAGMSDASLSQNLKIVGDLKTATVQRDALTLLKSTAQPTRAEVFSEHERILRLIMLVELGLSGLAIFGLIGISIFDKNEKGIPDSVEAEPTASLPSVSPALPVARSPIFAKSEKIARPQ